MAGNNFYLPFGVANGVIVRRQETIVRENVGRNFPNQNVYMQPPHLNDLGNNFYVNAMMAPAQQQRQEINGKAAQVQDQANVTLENLNENLQNVNIVNNRNGNGPRASPHNWVPQGQLSWEQLQQIYPYQQVYADLNYYKEECERLSKKLTAEKRAARKQKGQIGRMKVESRVLRDIVRREEK